MSVANGYHMRSTIYGDVLIQLSYLRRHVKGHCTISSSLVIVVYFVAVLGLRRLISVTRAKAQLGPWLYPISATAKKILQQMSYSQLSDRKINSNIRVVQVLGAYHMPLGLSSDRIKRH